MNDIVKNDNPNKALLIAEHSNAQPVNFVVPSQQSTSSTDTSTSVENTKYFRENEILELVAEISPIFEGLTFQNITKQDSVMASIIYKHAKNIRVPDLEYRIAKSAILSKMTAHYGYETIFGTRDYNVVSHTNDKTVSVDQFMDKFFDYIDSGTQFTARFTPDHFENIVNAVNEINTSNFDPSRVTITAKLRADKLIKTITRSSDIHDLNNNLSRLFARS